MTICRISIYLAYAMAVYTIASIYYIIMTRNIGTPFKDSLTLKQRQIKELKIDFSSFNPYII